MKEEMLERVKNDKMDLRCSVLETRENYLELEDSTIIEESPNWSEEIVRFFTSPTVAPLLMSLGFLGLMFEIKSPGFGVPGIAGLICLGLFFGAHLFVGLADMTEILLLGFGFLLILA